jgi:hypothetical protein
MKQQAEILLNHARNQGLRVETVNLDRDSSFGTGFDAVLKATGTGAIATTVRASNLNATLCRPARSAAQRLACKYLNFFLTKRAAMFSAQNAVKFNSIGIVEMLSRIKRLGN